MSKSRYPDNWDKIARERKEAVGWKCQKCGIQCLKPEDDRSKLTISDIKKITLAVHHANYKPEDNRPENLIPLCNPCHLSYHTRRKGSVSIGQLSLFDY
ncbi:HNH endonuclease [Geminocystis sp. CENA526]|uniref:HNH endonuclease n=1 Tax=Geminocystis sp. CENA526 TaxID=1355871 RepID=UPI003D6F354F